MIQTSSPIRVIAYCLLFISLFCGSFYDADAQSQGRVGQEPRPVKINENGRVPQPRHRQALVAPTRGLRLMRRGRHSRARFRNSPRQKFARVLARKTRIRLQVG